MKHVFMTRIGTKKMYELELFDLHWCCFMYIENDDNDWK